MPFQDWEDVEKALQRALELLAEGDFLILGEPTVDPVPVRRLSFRRSRTTATRYVQVLRIEDLFTAECVGATSLGGSWKMSQASIERLHSLGWRGPDEGTREFESVTPNFDMYVALSAAPILSELLVASLCQLGAQPQDLILQTSQ